MIKKKCLMPLFLFIVLFCNIFLTDYELLGSGVRDSGSEMQKDEAIRLFTDANEKYVEAAKFITVKNNQEAEKKLHDAALQYEKILINGFKHGQIYYNLGNTYYRRGELGKAIVNYRRAQRLMPRNTDLNANMRLVKSIIEDKELSHETPAVIQKVFFWLFFLNQNELIATAMSIYGVLMVLLLLLIIFRYRWCKKIIPGFIVCLCIIVISIGIKLYREEGVDRGVITSEKCYVRYGPGEEYEPKFEIHDGAECVVEDEKDGWYRVYVYISVAEGTDVKVGSGEKISENIRRGWLQKKDIDII
ncbi:MAG: tetratricopeptide repeat protein [wastewater metagenome]|nr:tetratricopeptide repeat protein [Candidatus Loosdrechtia aerotolerans]